MYTRQSFAVDVEQLNTGLKMYLYSFFFTVIRILYKYKKQLQKIEKKVGMEYQKAYKQG